jgi:hypothetical protein
MRLWSANRGSRLRAKDERQAYKQGIYACGSGFYIILIREEEWIRNPHSGLV